MTPVHCKAARALLGWSQNDLASKAGVSRCTVAELERGKHPTRSTVNMLMRAFREAGGPQVVADFAKSFDLE